MNRSQPPDAFSQMLESSKPRLSHTDQTTKQQQLHNSILQSTVVHDNDKVNEPSNSNRGITPASTVNHLSRVFESTQLDSNKPAIPIKPQTVKSSTTTLRNEPKSSRANPESGIDQTSFNFKDIRARFQQENSLPIKSLPQSNYRPPTPLKPSKTGPTHSPGKIIIAAKTGPPALPAKPKAHTLNRYPEQLTSALLDHNKIPTPLSTTNTASSSTLNIPNNTTATPMLSRTATGNDSLLSTTSTSSQTSTLSRRGWHLSSWFTGHHHNQPDPHEQLKNSIRRTDTNQQNNNSDNSSLSGVDTSTTTDEYHNQNAPSLSSTSPSSSPNSTHTNNAFIPQPPSGTTTSTARTTHHIMKRSKVIQELLNTEKTYQKDMGLLKSIYYDGACQREGSLFSKSDIRHLFSNLTEIVEFEMTFVALLEDSCEQDLIGTSFRETMRSIDIIYSEYCKRQEDAVIKLQELEQLPEVQEFLAQCKEQMQGKTTSWDLGSLLIKPVQRVLKYPLLLREIHSLTPNTHPDYENLTAAVKEIQQVADNINEIKRRKDIVERIVGDKKRTDISVVHGINKKLSRRAQKLKQATGFAVEPTHDAQFEALYAKFEEQQELVRQLARDVQGWVRHVKIGFENLQQLACSMESLYGSWGGVKVKSLTGISDFSKMASQLSSNLARELDNDVRGYIYSRIDDFLKIFENPTQVIYKRSMKMIDYDRVRDMKMKGDVPDKALQESADAYVSINAQLVDELPQFFALTAKYFDFMTGSLALVQMKFYKRMQKDWTKLVQQNLGLEIAQTYETIIASYMSQIECVDNAASQISILQRDNRYANSVGSNSSSSLLLKPRTPSDLYSPQDTSSVYSGHSTIAPSMDRRTNTASSFTAATEVERNLLNPQPNDSIISSGDFNCIVLYDFETHEEDRLDVKRGTILRVSQDDDYIDPDWWYGTTLDDFRSGWIPINYCKKI